MAKYINFGYLLVYMNSNYSKLIRISEIDFCIIERFIAINYIEKYPIKANTKIPMHELITFLIMEELGIYYKKLKQECENELYRNKH